MINDMQAAYMFMSVSVIERLFHRNRVLYMWECSAAASSLAQSDTCDETCVATYAWMQAWKWMQI